MCIDAVYHVEEETAPNHIPSMWATILSSPRIKLMFTQIVLVIRGFGNPINIFWGMNINNEIWNTKLFFTVSPQEDIFCHRPPTSIFFQKYQVFQRNGVLLQKILIILVKKLGPYDNADSAASKISVTICIYMICSFCLNVFKKNLSNNTSDPEVTPYLHSFHWCF